MTLSAHQEELLNREREAFVEMFEHEENMKGRVMVDTKRGGSEWEDPDALLVHDWDLEEMNDDMNAWECELAIQEHLALGFDHENLVLPVKITTHGDNYSTGECDFGKVFVPKVALSYFNGDEANCFLRFNGMDGTRIHHTNPSTGKKHEAIAMPWRCMRVVT